jgi:hypothetical protein
VRRLSPGCRSTVGSMSDLAQWVGLGGYMPGQWQAVGTMVDTEAAVVTAIVVIAAAAFVCSTLSMRGSCVMSRPSRMSS